MDPKTEIAWNMLVELRKEILEAQKNRAQVIGFKITFVSTAAGLIVANKIELALLVVPALAALFFDFLINSYSVSIKHKGLYCRSYIEPKLRAYSEWPSNEPLWEEYMSRPRNKQRLSLIGNLGISALAYSAAMVGLAVSAQAKLSLLGGVLLTALFAFAVVAYLRPRWIAESLPENVASSILETKPSNLVNLPAPNPAAPADQKAPLPGR